MPMASRVKIVAKLTLLVGGPLAIVFSIFASGMYFGVKSPRGVLSFERGRSGRRAQR